MINKYRKPEPKEKAKDLFDKMDIDSGSWNMDEVQSIGCAEVCVKEIIQALNDNNDYSKHKVSVKYWEDVMQEIKLL